MAVYSLTNVRFDVEDDRIIARAEILKDGVNLQAFAVSLKMTTKPAELAQAIASHAKNIVIHDTLVAETFVQAAEWLEQQSWNYG